MKLSSLEVVGKEGGILGASGRGSLARHGRKYPRLGIKSHGFKHHLHYSAVFSFFLYYFVNTDLMVSICKMHKIPSSQKLDCSHHYIYLFTTK